MKNFSVWSRSRLFLPGTGADPIWSEPELESPPGPRTSGAAQKSGGSATLKHFFLGGGGGKTSPFCKKFG